jgi:hypothetical protein
MNNIQSKRNTLRDAITTTSKPDNFIKYALMFIVLIASTLFFYNFAKIEEDFSMDTFVYVGLIIFLFLIVLFVVYPSIQKGGSSAMVIFSLIVMAIAFTISYLSSIFTSSQSKAMAYILFVIAMVIISVGLAIFFYLYSSYLKNRPGIVGFIINFIFYIPCLIIDFSEWAQKELNMTSKTIYILFFIECFLITAFFTYPLIYKKYLKPGVDLLPGSVFLNKPQKIAVDSEALILPDTKLATRNLLYELLFPNVDDPGMERPDAEYQFSPNFSISMWVYLNVQTNSFASAKDMTIFSYGAGKPKITYNNSTTDKKMKDLYRISFTEDTDASNPDQVFEISLPGQKWNNFVFNYTTNHVDLFINGNLEKHINLSANGLSLPKYLVTDSITVGSEGLNGAICNISYMQVNMTKNQIITDYNLLVKKNPPVSIE